MHENKNNEKIHLSRRVRVRAIGDDGVLVHLENGRAMVVNEVGIFIVETLGRQDMTVAELADARTEDDRAGERGERTLQVDDG